MKRLFVSAALLPLLYAASAQAETKITTATTTPVRTSTLAAGQPDSLTIDTSGSIAATVAGAVVTVDSKHTVTNSGTISSNNVSGSTGIQVNGGVTTTITSGGGISLVEDYTATDADSDGDLDGALAQGSGRYGIRATGPGAVTGNIANGGAIQVEGNDSAGISIETRLNGTLTHSGAITITGDRSVGLRADSVSGDVKVLGAVTALGEGSVGVQTGDVEGALVIQGGITSTAYRTATRQADAVRAKFDADDLKQGGAAVRITGNVGKGILLDKPPADSSTTDTDEDKDGILDAAESVSSIQAYGAAPALDIGGASATTIGAVGTGDLAFGLINRGSILGDGVNDAVTGTAIRIGQAGGGTVTVQGISNIGGASIVARAYGAQSTAVLLNANAVVPVLNNAGTIGAEQNGGLQDARGIVDLSGTLGLVQNSGIVRALVNPTTGVTQTGKAIAIDLSANTAGAVVRQAKVATTDAPAIGGDVLFGSGADRLELLGGTLAGTMSFGAGADTLVLDGGASAAGRIVDTDGKLSIDIRDGRLALANTEAVAVTSLNLGAKGVLAVTIDPTAANAKASRVNVAGAANLATGAQVEVTLSGLSRGTQAFQVVQAQSLTVGGASAALVGAPYLYQANLRADTAAGALFVDLRPKTATELGLNRSGSQAYPAVFESLDKNETIEQAFLAQKTQGGFQALYDQMLPDHSGGALMTASAISAAVSSAVSEPQAIDRDAASGVWAQEVAFNIDHDRVDAAGYGSKGFGFAAGLDMQGRMNALGANVSFVTADIQDDNAAAGEQVTMNLLGAGLYWRLDGGPFQAAVRGGLGYGFFDGDRRLVATGLDVRAKADWNGWTADAAAQASYEMKLGAFYARPELSVSYLRLAEDGYTEKGSNTGFNLTVDKRTGELLTGQALLALGWRFGDEVYWAPEIKAGYRAKLAGDPGSTTAHFDGGADFTLDPEDPFKGGAVIRAGFRGGGAKVLYAVNAGGAFDKDYTEYDVRAVIRFQF